MTSNRNNNYSGRVPDARRTDPCEDIYETDGETNWSNEHVIDINSAVSGKYANRNPLDMINDEIEYLPIDDYLYQMNPKDPKEFNRSEVRSQEKSKRERSMDPGGNRSKKKQLHPNDMHPNTILASKIEASPIGTVSVKCTPSSPEIVGTPSQVVLKLNQTIQRYIPRRNGLLQDEINQEVDDIENGDDENSNAREPEDLVEEEEDYWCPGDLNLDVENCAPPKENYCPGTRDLLTGKKVPCTKARVLREIALGRRIPRQYLPPKVPDEEYEEVSAMDDLQDAEENLEDEQEVDDEDGCCCAKVREERQGISGKITKSKFRTNKKKPCCLPRTGKKSSKCVSFAK